MAGVKRVGGVRILKNVVNFENVHKVHSLKREKKKAQQPPTHRIFITSASKIWEHVNELQYTRWDILHTSVIRDFYIEASTICLTPFKYVHVKNQHQISLSKSMWSWDHFISEAQASSEDQDYACWGKLPMTWGGRCSTVSPLPSLPVSPTHARPCNSPITQWRMSRCCEILFLKCTCLNSL